MSNKLQKVKGPSPIVVPGDVILPDIPKKLGRPSRFSQHLANKLCKELSLGRSLRTIYRDNDWCPDISTIFNWMHKFPKFLEQYAHAKEESADALADEILSIADDSSNDWMTIGKGDNVYEVENREVTNRSRLRIDTRKWLASKLKPKKYGEHLDLTSDGKPLPTPIYGGKSLEK